MPGRAVSVGVMASRPPLSGDPVAASADSPDAVAAEKKLAAALESKLPPDDEEEGDEDDELELDDEDDEELVVYTAREAAGALATVYGFVKPFLSNYKKLIAFVSLGVLV
jgi:ATP-binding cassette subfamily B protein